MGAFYDKILVDRAKKLGKQYGSKVEKGEVDTSGMKSVYEDQIKKLEKRIAETSITSNIRKSYQRTIDSLKERIKDAYAPETAWTMNLTDKLKKAAKDGLPYYVALPPIVAGVASQQAEASEVKKPAVQVKSKRILEEATQ